MTGQVKEDVLSRFGELGVFVAEGRIYFNPCLLRKNEFTTEERVYRYVTVKQEHKTLAPPIGSLCFTYCQVPVIYCLANENSIVIEKHDGSEIKQPSLYLNQEISTLIFNRTGEISKITVFIHPPILK
jgi:hypothetical protein